MYFMIIDIKISGCNQLVEEQIFIGGDSLDYFLLTFGSWECNSIFGDSLVSSSIEMNNEYVVSFKYVP